MNKTEKTFPRLLVLSVFLAAGVFVVDLLIPLGAAGGVPYVALILVSLWSPQKKHTIIAAIAGTVLTILGFFFSPSGGIPWMVFVNRFLALFAIWVTAILSLQRKQVEEALRQAKEGLRKHCDHLDKLVKDRTSKLARLNEELQREIEERKQAEEALRSSEEKYRDLYENAPNAYFSIRAVDGSILECNTSATRLLGYDREILTGMKVFGLYADTPHGLSKAEEVFERFQAGESIRDTELQMKHKDGCPIWASLSAEPVRDDDGNVTEAKFAMIDISERKRLETQLIQMQKMEAIGTLAGGIAHDFNNLLMTIIVNIEFALKKMREETPARKGLNLSLKAANRARDLVEQILTYSRESEDNLQPLEVTPIVKESLKMLRASLPTTIELRQRIETNSDTVIATPSQIHQILINLCSNAAHAMRESCGILDVTLTDETFDSNSGHNHPDIKPGPYLKLTVKDTGHGMSYEVMDRIFDPFFTTKKIGDGTGMGLSVVHGIVKKIGGAIKVKSELGGGSVFEIFLPEVEKEIVLAVDSFSAPQNGNGRLLVIDDEKIIVETLERVLGDLGYHVIGKTSSVEALKVFRQTPEQFDLVITDQTMPNTTGVNLAKEILSIRSDIPIILCTGFSEMISKEEALTLGIREFFMKPIITSELAETISKILKEN